MHRLALIGCGDVAQRDYLPEFYRLSDRLELAAVCSRTEERARAVAERFGAGAWYTDYSTMLRECDADLIANLTPIQSHTAITLAALRAGKHVYTEKPVASTVRDARSIQEAAQPLGRVLVCAPCVLLFPQVRYARALLGEGAIGPVYSAHGQGQMGVPPWSGYTSDPSPFFAAGGGPALDMGVYPLHALTGLLGPVRRVGAMTARVQHGFTVADGPLMGKQVPIEVDDNWHITLDFGDGRLASVECGNSVQGTRVPQLELCGLRGTMAVNLLDVSAPVELLKEGSDWVSVAVPHARRAGPDHLLGIEHLIDCVEGRTMPVLSIEHAIHVLEIIEKAAQAAREGRTLTLESTFAPRTVGG
ncbi:MAG: Gfo/Idh/MocA family protein [Chloroflexota bacterium]